MYLWLSLLPSIVTVACAIWSKKILPSLFLGLFIGSYLLKPTLIGGLEKTVNSIVTTLADKDNLQVLLFLYLFSGLIALIRNAGGITAFSDIVSKHVQSERGVFYTLWALIPITFIDCGFRIVGAGSIIKSLAQKNKIENERIAFFLNNTASPMIELIPVATTFVGFNVANIGLGLKAAGISKDFSAYDVLLRAIPYEFFSIIVLVITFSTIFYEWRKKPIKSYLNTRSQNQNGAMMMDMKVNDTPPEIQPRLINLMVPIIMVISLSLFFFWYFEKSPNEAMLVALFVSLVITISLYFLQKYKLSKITKDMISGGNELMKIIIILVLAWSLGSVSQELHLGKLVQQQLGSVLPDWSVPVVLFLISSSVTYFIGSGWAAASLIMPFALSLAMTSGAGIPITVGAVITGGTFGDVTSPVAGMTNMASHMAGADQIKYLKYAAPYNFTALIVAAILFLTFGFLG